MTRLAAAFETLIADAPDQWWAVFFPIWPDLEAATAGGAPADGTGSDRAGRRGMTIDERLGRADLHIHTLASDGTAGIEAILDHVERRTDLDVIAIIGPRADRCRRRRPGDGPRSWPAR